MRLDEYHNLWYTWHMDKKRKVKTSTSFSLSDECKQLIRAMAKQMGISQASVIELCVRDKAKERGLYQ